MDGVVERAVAVDVANVEIKAVGAVGSRIWTDCCRWRGIWKRRRKVRR